MLIASRESRVRAAIDAPARDFRWPWAKFAAGRLISRKSNKCKRSPINHGAAGESGAFIGLLYCATSARFAGCVANIIGA